MRKVPRILQYIFRGLEWTIENTKPETVIDQYLVLSPTFRFF